MSIGTLPVVDLAAPERDVGQAIREACLGNGFFYLVNHGVPQPVLESAFEANAAFHARPLEEKLDIAMNAHFRGFQPLGSSTLRVSTVESARLPNQSESFFVRHETPSSEQGRCPIDGPNIWPREPKDFREVTQRYVNAVTDAAHRLLTPVAHALGEMPKAFRAGYFERPSTTLRYLHYPPAVETRDDAYGIAPHTDYGFLTLLAQDDGGGLEIRSGSGQWHAVTPLDGSFVVNVGNALTRMTNGHFVSTAHRVVNPSRERSRYSIAFFFDPCLDAEIAVLDAFADGRAEPAMKFGDYFHSRLAANFDVELLAHQVG